MGKPERRTPFSVSQIGANLPASNLTAEEFRRFLLMLSIDELPGFLRSQVRFRVPAAFMEKPMLWEALRKWLAERLQIDAHEIGLVGSAQIGFSSDPNQFGKPFSKSNSDLDFFVVSNSLFESLTNEARQFCAQVGTPQAEEYRDQIDYVSRTLKKGFFNLNQIPTSQEYPRCSNLNNIASMVVDKLRCNNFELKRSHFRVYQLWRDHSKQVLLSYSDAKTRLG